MAAGYSIQHDGPPVGAPPSDPPTIEIQAGKLHVLADEAESALLATGAEVYQRGPFLVRPAVTEVPAADIWVNGERTQNRKTLAGVLSVLEAPSTIDELSRAARWEKYNERKKAWVAADPPEKVARVLLSRSGRWRVPSAKGVINTPTLRDDGTLVTRPGFDSASGYYLALSPDFDLPAISESPSRSEAVAALNLLEGLFSEFPFVGETSRSVALSGLITPVVRPALPVVPLHGVSGPTIGSGKSFLVDLFAAVGTGRQCPVLSFGASVEELDKKLTGMLLGGMGMISIDNVRCELDSDVLCQAAERPLLSLRRLGDSEIFTTTNSSCLFATGNNLSVTDEMVRRAVLAVLDAKVERPELRCFTGNPIAAVLANRGRYVAAVLTIIRAYIAAGRPGDHVPFGSYSAWSAFVREPLIWLGKLDPVKSQDLMREVDPVVQELAGLMRGWEAVIGLNVPRTSSDLKVLVNRGLHRTLHESDDQWQVRQLAFPEFRDALVTVAGERGLLDSNRLGAWLRRRKGRIVNGRRFMADEGTSGGTNRWRLMNAT